MKSARVFSVLAAVGLLVYAVERHFEARGRAKMLTAIQAVRHGMSKDEVRELMGRRPTVVPAQYLSDWLKEVVPEKEKGEYWYFFMGYPSWNLIIYFGEDGTVGF